MSTDLSFLILFPLTLFVLWFGLEFRAPLFLRLIAGTIFFLLTMLLTGASIIGAPINAQVEYGGAAKRLVEAMRVKIASGDCEAAKQLVDQLDESFQPSYEGNGFPVFVDRAIEAMKRETTTK